MNALIRGDLPLAQQASRKLLFFMEHVPYPEKGQAQARLTKSIAAQIRDSEDIEEAAMGFARLSQACGQCHHALDRGPPLGLDETPEGDDLPMHMRRHYWAVEKMWEALLTDSPIGFQRGARALAEAPLLGDTPPSAESPPGTTRLAYEVHDLAFAAAVEGNGEADDYVPAPGEPREPEPTTRGQTELFGRLLSTCSQCHTLLEVSPALTYEERRRGTP